MPEHTPTASKGGCALIASESEEASVPAAVGGPCYCSGMAPGRVSKSPPFRYLQCEVSGPKSK